MNGEITTVMVDANLDVSSVMTDGKLTGTKNAIFSNANYSSDKVITGLTPYESNNVKDVYAAEATGTAKLSGDSTIGFGTSSITYWTVAKDCKVFYVNAGGVISQYSTSSIGTDDNDVVNYIVDNGEVSYIFIQEVPSDVKDPGSSTSATYTAALTKESGKVILTVTSTSDTDAKVSGTITVSNLTGGNSATIDITAGTVKRGNNYTFEIASTSNVQTYKATVTVGSETLTTGTVIGG